MTRNRGTWSRALIAKVVLASAFSPPLLRAAPAEVTIESDGALRSAQAPLIAVDEASLAANAEAKAIHVDTALPPADHVPPPPPTHPLGALPMAQMGTVMEMDDDAAFSMLLIDRLEHDFSGRDSSTAWNLRAWIGRDFDKLSIKSEGEHARGDAADGDVEALWSHAVATYWDSQLGVRHDFGAGRDRTWLALGAQGLAPYWFDVEATAYVGDGGRTALRLESEYDLRLSQRLIVQPRFELNAYGRSDSAARIGAGVSDAELGIRLRYEIRREFAPYVGIEWRRAFGATADLARARGDGVFDDAIVAGVRVWF